MKKNIILLFVLLLSSITLFAQAPNTFKYQAVVRDTFNNIIPNHNIGIRASILEDSPTGICVYSESFNVTTSAVGLINLNIGGGTPLLGAFAGIDWSTGFYWIKLEVDMTGGTTYTPLGTPSQLVSVPYAKFADRAGKAAFPAGMVMAFAGDTLNIPEGWLLCDGKEISRSIYSDLFNAIGVAWGAGNLTSTFNLPDMRGTFLRGVDYNKGNDPDDSTRTASNNGGNTGNIVGSMQNDSFQSHNHTGTSATAGSHSHSASSSSTGSHTHPITTRDDAESPGGSYISNTAVTNTNVTINTGSAGAHSHTISVASDGAHAHTLTISASGSGESRPKNVYVNYIIKY